MPILSITEEYTLPLNGFTQSLTTVVHSDRKVAEGGFGIVYEVESINNGQTSVPLILKIFNNKQHPEKNRKAYETIRVLQEKIREYIVSHNYDIPEQFTKEFPALIALPIWSFAGRDEDNKLVYGLISLDLNRYGYFSLNDLSENTESSRDSLTTFLNQPQSIKIQLCYHLVKALYLLESEFSFQHSDLKQDAIWISKTGSLSAFIDFDGGVFHEGVKNNKLFKKLTANLFSPQVVGSRQPWLAPELLEKFSATAITNEFKPTWESEYWSTAAAIFFIFSGQNPLFYLGEMDLNFTSLDIKKFYENNSWPGSKGLRSELRDYIGTDLWSELENTFGFGYTLPKKRTSFKVWAAIFYALANKNPELAPKVQFNVNPEKVLEGEKVQLTWDVTNAYEVALDPLGMVAKTGSKSHKPSNIAAYTLHAFGHFGRIKKSIEVEVVSLPVIEKFVASRKIIQQGSSILLAWTLKHTEVAKLAMGHGAPVIVSPEDSLEVHPLDHTTYTIYAASKYNLKEITQSLDVIVVPPVRVQFFQADSPYTIQGKPITLRWAVENADEITIEPIGFTSKKGSGKHTFHVKADETYRLVARNEFWEESSTLDIAVLSVQIPKFKLPSVPNFDLSFLKKIDDIIEPLQRIGDSSYKKVENRILNDVLKEIDKSYETPEKYNGWKKVIHSITERTRRS